MAADEEFQFTRDPLIRAFATLLRTLREERKLSRAKLAEALGCTAQWIEKLERMERPPSEQTANDLDTYFQTPGRMFWTIWREIRRAGKHLTLPPGFEGFVQREADADEMWIFEALAVTGLFQTPEYATEILKTGGRKSDVVEELVARRMERQSVLASADPPMIVAVFDEGAVRRQIGGREVLKAQLARLIELAQEPNVVLQIVPADKGAYAGLAGNFTILTFDDAPDVVYIEGHSDGFLYDQRTKVREHVLRFSLIRAAAMSADDSLALLKKIMESL